MPYNDQDKVYDTRFRATADIPIPSLDPNAKNILLGGNIKGLFGYYMDIDLEEGVTMDISQTDVRALNKRLSWMVDRLIDGAKFTILGNESTAEEYRKLFSYLRNYIKFDWNMQIRFKIVSTHDEYIQYLKSIKTVHLF